MATIRSARHGDLKHGDLKHGHFPHITLNSDGRPHPILNVAAVLILVIGLTAFVLGIIIANISNPGPALAVPAAVLGLVSLFGGLYAQMVSATREERVLIVAGIICGFVGLALGLAHGGLG
ncbi:MAG: hypothetical protein ACRDN0_05290 [Trebonia sp.]